MTLILLRLLRSWIHDRRLAGGWAHAAFVLGTSRMAVGSRGQHAATISMITRGACGIASNLRSPSASTAVDDKFAIEARIGFTSAP